MRIIGSRAIATTLIVVDMSVCLLCCSMVLSVQSFLNASPAVLVGIR